MAVFGEQELEAILDRAVARDLHEQPRTVLFMNISPAYYDALERHDQNRRIQLMMDLGRMNQDGVINRAQPPEQQHFPLFRWLRNAQFILAGYPDDQTFFREKADRALDWQTALNAPPPPTTSPPPPAAGPATDASAAVAVAEAATHEEEVLFDSELLPIGYLRGAIRTARAVGRIEVPRRVNGQAQVPSSAGTCWLIGRRHIITNYHVMRARVRGEGDPSEADLRLQAGAAKITFDFDDDTSTDATMTTRSIAALCSWDIELDYAVAQLAEPLADRESLPLLDKVLTIDQNSRYPVNIIQHPGGYAKQIAIRNNLAVRADGPHLAYFTDTDKGSSGSPVCDDEWRVVALHRAATRELGTFRYQGKDTVWINVGTPIRLILDRLRQDTQLWNDIGATVIAG